MSNVQVSEVQGDEVKVRSPFLVYSNRLADGVNVFVGKLDDVFAARPGYPVENRQAKDTPRPECPSRESHHHLFFVAPPQPPLKRWSEGDLCHLKRPGHFQGPLQGSAAAGLSPI